MNDLNSIILEGKLVRDPDSGTTGKGHPYCNFTIKVRGEFKEDEQLVEEISYFDVTAKDRVIEACKMYLRKDSFVRIIGRIKQSRWTEGNGKLMSRVFIFADEIKWIP